MKKDKDLGWNTTLLIDIKNLLRVANLFCYALFLGTYLDLKLNQSERTFEDMEEMSNRWNFEPRFDLCELNNEKMLMSISKKIFIPTYT